MNPDLGSSPSPAWSVSLVDGHCVGKVPRLHYLNELMTVGLKEQNLGLPLRSLVICVAIFPAQQFPFPSTLKEGNQSLWCL